MRHGRTGVLGLALPPRDADPNQKPQTLTHPFPTTPHSFHCDTWSQTESTHTHTPTRTPAASSGGARGARLERGHQSGAGIVGYWHRERMMMIRPLSKLLGAGGQPNEACRALGLAAVFFLFNNNALGVVRGLPSSGPAKRTAQLPSARAVHESVSRRALWCTSSGQRGHGRRRRRVCPPTQSVLTPGVRPSEPHHAVVSLSGAVRP